MNQAEQYLRQSKTTAVNPVGSQLFFQPKLKINQTGDSYEQGADEVAEKLMRKEEPRQRFFSPPVIQRSCADCEEDDSSFAKASEDKSEKQAQRKESNDETTAQTENYLSSLSSGKELTEKERDFFEPGLDADLSNVRIHTDNAANESAKNINALAYTHRNNIVFAEGQYQPNTDEGKKLLAHELTHTVQQTGMVQRKPDCSYETLQNEITAVGQETKYLKATPSTGADNFPGDPVTDGDNVVVKNSGGAATYNNVKNCTWAWIEVPGKKSPDKKYPVLHGFIEVKYLKAKASKKEEPEKEEPKQQAPSSEVIGNIEGPEIIYAGGSFQYTASPLAPLSSPVDLGSLKWSFKYDDGTVHDLDTKDAVTIEDDTATLNVKIPSDITASGFTVYAYTTSPEQGGNKVSSLQPVSIVESKKEKGKNVDGTVADDMKYKDLTKQNIQDIGTLFQLDEWADYTDDQLFSFLEDMATTLFSVGELQTNALAMISHFKENTGSNYSNPILTKAVQEHDTTKRFVDRVLMVLSKKIMDEKEALQQTDVTRGELEKFRPVFNSTADTFAGGLTFAINDTWAHSANIMYYDYKTDDDFKGTLKLTLYDDFGLDLPDVEKKFGYLQGFRAWFILQHERGYKPFITVVEFEVPFDQAIKQIEPRILAEEKRKKELDESFKKNLEKRRFEPKY